MFSLQRLLGKDEHFFDLLEASAEQACCSVEALVQMLKKPVDERTLDEFSQTRRKDKRITEDISNHLCKTFVTPLEREDIEELSTVLYKIPKTVEKFGEQFLIAHQHLAGVEFTRQTQFLEQATATVLQLVKALRHKPKLEAVKDQIDKLQHIEGDADKLMLALEKELYGGQYQPLQVIILRNLYELLEKVVDRCRDAGNVVFHIVLKYS